LNFSLERLQYRKYSFLGYTATADHTYRNSLFMPHSENLALPVTGSWGVGHDILVEES